MAPGRHPELSPPVPSPGVPPPSLSPAVPGPSLAHGHAAEEQALEAMVQAMGGPQLPGRSKTFLEVPVPSALQHVLGGTSQPFLLES